MMTGSVRLERSVEGGATYATSDGSYEGNGSACNGVFNGAVDCHCRDSNVLVGACAELEIYILEDTVYGNRRIRIECKTIGARPLITACVTLASRGKDAGDAWGGPIREQLAGDEDADVSRLGKEQGREKQADWKERVKYGGAGCPRSCSRRSRGCSANTSGRGSGIAWFTRQSSRLQSITRSPPLGGRAGASPGVAVGGRMARRQRQNYATNCF